MANEPKLVLVHADGGDCHGTPLRADNVCPKCGIHPDTQSTEFWPEKSSKPTPVEVKTITLNVDIHFEVPVDYKVTDEESIEFLGNIMLRGSNGLQIEYVPSCIDHETISTMDF